MRVVVTGGAGFIGSRLVRALAERGDEAIVIDDLSTGNARRLPAGVDIFCLHAEEAATANLIAEIRPRVVFHLAAQVGMGISVKCPAEDGRSNMIGTLRVLEGCRKAGSKLVFSSTSGVYGDSVGSRPLRETSPKRPSAPYGLSKWMAEQYIGYAGKWWGIPYTILRYANVYGPGQAARGEGGVVACFMERIASGQPLVIHGDGEQSRDFVHVDDVVRANIAAIAQGDGETFNIGTGIATSINGLADRCERLAAASYGRLYEPGRSGDARSSRLSSRKASDVLGWKPALSLEEGLSRLFGRK
ncbi:NAD-dependent epimerase/dehydratase family protein [Cohnella sp.]|uniref:NAD-dependent epimerase/dehydratase family protein n=1 Tax=Cohnella sp. TaxID=1883426 RepID=UPI00356B1763